MSSIKQKRLEGIIRKDISDIVQFEVKDADVGFVTITDVEVSNDHSYAKVYVSFLGKDARAQAGLKALNRAKGFIRSALSQRLSIRRTPELTFVFDTTEEHGRHIDEIIASLHEEETENEEPEETTEMEEQEADA
ncbi:MAG: 30S ribosome-binding factor RbfA [Erysipelotrichaceae bacterium]|nr:30S ribosome-binding factor RbfA [Erysipelotrichaceae bacterium]